MKLKEFHKLIGGALKKSGGVKSTVDIEFWHGEKQLFIESMGQFGFVRDVNIHLTDEPPSEAENGINN